MYSSNSSSYDRSNASMFTAEQLHLKQSNSDQLNQASKDNPVLHHLNANTGHINQSRCGGMDNFQKIMGVQLDHATKNTKVPRPNITQSLFQPEPSRLDLKTIWTELDNNDPFQAFVLNPGAGETGNLLFSAIACKDLPISIRQLELDFQSQQIRNVLGIVYKHISPQDKWRADKICKYLKVAKDDYKKQTMIGEELSILLHKYGKEACYRQVMDVTECCRKVWCYHNPEYVGELNDRYIFSQVDVEFCYTVIHGVVGRLTKPKQDWIDIICQWLYLQSSCSALGVCINTSPGSTPSLASINETFESIYPQSLEDFSYSSNDDKTKGMKSSNNQGFLKKLLNVFTGK